MRAAAALMVLLLAAAPALAREDAPVATAPQPAAPPQAAESPPPQPQSAQPPQHSGDNPATASEDSEEPDPNAPPPPPSGPSPGDLAYEARIRASVAAAQSYQGPLDGRWVLYAAHGRELFTFQAQAAAYLRLLHTLRSNPVATLPFGSRLNNPEQEDKDVRTTRTAPRVPDTCTGQ